MIIERTHVARNNEIVIAVVDGEVYVKRLQKDTVRRIVKLTSANPAYLDIELKEEELDKFRIIGVISQIKLFNAGSGWRTLTCVLVYVYAYAIGYSYYRRGELEA